jgi:hypothetical protein
MGKLEKKYYYLGNISCAGFFKREKKRIFRAELYLLILYGYHCIHTKQLIYEN